MKKSISFLVVYCLCLCLTYSQTNKSDTLFTINHQAYSSTDFLKYYQSNSQANRTKPPQSITEALEVYLQFHLKLTEALNQKMDTLAEFQKEFNTYHEQLINSYLYPVKLTENKIKEAYIRMQHYLKVRHILIRVKKNASPADTLYAYNKANTIRKQLLKGANFSKLARQHSADLSVRSNKGNLGYFTVFQMIYPFESAAYKLQLQEISKPVRTKFGYHIIQLMDKKVNPGRIKVAHLMISVPRKANANQRQKGKQKIDSLYQKILQGEDFIELVAKHSMDKKSAKNKGELPWFEASQMFPNFEAAAFSLKKDNAISVPVSSPYGWHILKRIQRIELGSLEDHRKQIIQKIKKDGRCNTTQQELIRKLKKQYNFKESRELLTNFYSILDYAYADLSEPLFTLADSDFSQVSFADYLSKQPSKEMNEDFKDYINRVYDNFANNSILAIHKQNLIEKNPRLKNLLQEYYNGILVYNISDKMVWSASANDPIGLKDFFTRNYKVYEKEHGYNVQLESIRGLVISHFQDTLQKQWVDQLKKNNRIRINSSELKKLQQQYDK